MTKYNAFLLISVFMLLLGSCKNEEKEQKPETLVQTDVPIVKRAEKRDLTPEDVERINSVMTRLMSTPELKKYSSFLVTAGLTEELSNQAGPFTILAPSDAAFDSLDVEKRKFYLNPKNKEDLVRLLNSHIVEGNLDSSTLLQDIKSHSGKLMLKTRAGGSLTASTRNLDIIISDGNGEKAVMVKSDINGSNGVVHVIDAVLNTN